MDEQDGPEQRPDGWTDDGGAPGAEPFRTVDLGQVVLVAVIYPSGVELTPGVDERGQPVLDQRMAAEVLAKVAHTAMERTAEDGDMQVPTPAELERLAARPNLEEMADLRETMVTQALEQVRDRLTEDDAGPEVVHAMTGEQWALVRAGASEGIISALKHMTAYQRAWRRQ